MKDFLMGAAFVAIITTLATYLLAWLGLLLPLLIAMVAFLFVFLVTLFVQMTNLAVGRPSWFDGETSE